MQARKGTPRTLIVRVHTYSQEGREVASYFAPHVSTDLLHFLAHGLEDMVQLLAL